MADIFALPPERALFVFVVDYDCEGKGAPFQAVIGEAKAKRLYGIMQNSGCHSIVVYRVPMWPEIGEHSEINVYPVDWCLGPAELANKRKQEAHLAGTSPAKT